MIDLNSLDQELFNPPLIGVGLRHAHYEDVLTQEWPVDFLEVHSENFFSMGAAREYLKRVSKTYPISLHSTALGLGSESAIKESYLESLQALIEDIDPMMVSDHASFSWGDIAGDSVHIGDLLPIAFNENALRVMADNVNKVQNRLSIRLKIENLSAYLVPTGSTMSECEFLVRLVELTGCELLVDLNNLVVNAHNFSDFSALDYGKSWLSKIPTGMVGEFHLAGFSAVETGEIAIDDHSQPVSEVVWQLYEFALKRFGSVATLIEWDNHLPSWQDLLQEVHKARGIAKRVLSHD
jgi:uncharacterized protein (UPF0276 family)